MADEDGDLYWYDPDPRAILPLDTFHISRSLRRTVRQGQFQITTDNEFGAVIRACAQPGPGRDMTWISEDIIDAYTELHHFGYAHSVEAWLAGEMVGGLHGQNRLMGNGLTDSLVHGRIAGLAAARFATGSP